MKTIVLLVAMNIACTDNPAQSARNYPGAVVEVDDHFADKAIELGEAKLYVPPSDVPDAVAAALQVEATNTPQPVAGEPPKPSNFQDSGFGAEDA